MAPEIQAVSAPPGDPYTWEELPAAIEALQNGDDIDYQGAAGAIDLDDAGDATAGVYDLYEFKGTAPEPVTRSRWRLRAPDPVATGARAPSRRGRAAGAFGLRPLRVAAARYSGAASGWSMRAVPPR